MSVEIHVTNLITCSWSINPGVITAITMGLSNWIAYMIARCNGGYRL